MRIKSLSIKGLHDYINKEINFYEDINLLVGINGAGKTSVLNILNWLLKPSMPNLCLTEFKQLVLSFDYGKDKYIISCKKEKRVLEYQLSKNDKLLPPLTTDIYTSNRHRDQDELYQHYSNLKPDEDERVTWDLLMSIPSPIVIGLDRTLYTEDRNGIIVENQHLNRSILKVKTSPVESVKRMINREYTIRKNTVSKLTSQLKNSLMLYSFDSIITKQDIDYFLKSNLNLKAVASVENRIRKILQDSENGAFNDQERSTIYGYFNNLKAVITEKDQLSDENKHDILYIINVTQFTKIEKLLLEFEKFERNTNKEMKTIRDYVASLNYFLNDSGKQIFFNPNTSEISFNIINNEGDVIERNKDICHLSSGEQQLLILFSYIAFYRNQGNIFIIDEPELSLHIKWQEDFIEQLESIRPSSTQLILATHSPILVNKKRNNTILLQAKQ